MPGPAERVERSWLGTAVAHYPQSDAKGEEVVQTGAAYLGSEWTPAQGDKEGALEQRRQKGDIDQVL